MRVLELFSGTHSVGKVCKEYGWEVVSVDLENADINIYGMELENGKYKLMYIKKRYKENCENRE